MPSKVDVFREATDLTLQPVGQEVIQPAAQLKKENLGQGLSLRGVDHPMTLWYHDDGSTSLLKTALDSYYEKKPGFHRAATAEFVAAQENRLTCPVKSCGAPSIPLTIDIDTGAMTELGFDIEPNKETRRSIMLDHFKAFHPQTYASIQRVEREKDRAARIR